MDRPATYVPRDRRRALARGDVPASHDRAVVLVAELTGGPSAPPPAAAGAAAAVAFGAALNAAGAAVCAAVDRYAGSILALTGRTLLCAFSAGAEAQAATAALALREATATLDPPALPGGTPWQVRAAVASGPVQRGVAGDPAHGLFDVLGGPAVDAAWTLLAGAPPAGIRLAPAVTEALATHGPRGGAVPGGAAYALESLARPGEPDLWATLAADSLPEATAAPWRPRPVRREVAGPGGALAAIVISLRCGGDFAEPTAGPGRVDHAVRLAQAALAAPGGTLLAVALVGGILYLDGLLPAAGADPVARLDAAGSAALAFAGGLGAPPAAAAVAAGEVWQGVYGGPTRQTYGVWGAPLDAVHALVAHTPYGAVRAAGAAPSARWRALPPEAGACPVHQFLGPPLPLPPGLGPLAVALRPIGRADVLAAVDARLLAARSGTGQIVALAGGWGTGKTHLLAAVAERAAHAGFRVCCGTAPPAGAPRPAYSAWYPVWRAFFGLGPEETAPPAALLDGLRAAMPLAGTRLGLLPAVLGGAPAADAPAPGAAPRLRRAALEALCVECLTSRATGSDAPPLLIILDDCDLLDAPSLDLLLAVARAAAGLPLLLLLAYRPPARRRLRAVWTAGPTLTAVALPPLDPEAAALLLASHPPAAGLAPEALAERVAAGQGNPLRLLLGARAADARPGADDASPAAPELDALVLARIDACPPAARSLLQTAAIAGPRFTLADLQVLAPASEAAVTSQLLELARRGLLLPDPADAGAWHFVHPRVWELTAAERPHRDGAALHSRLAAALPATIHPGVRAHHAERGLDRARQRAAAAEAGAAAALLGDPAAVDHYARALAVRDADVPPAARVALLLAQAAALEDHDAGAAAEQRYRLALGEARAAGDPRGAAAALLALGRVSTAAGLYAEAAGWLDEAAAACTALDDTAARAHVLAAQGRLAGLRDDRAGAEAAWAASIACARTAGDRAAEAAGLEARGLLAASGDEPTTARAAYLAALALYEALEDVGGRAGVLNNLGVLAATERDTGAAHGYYAAGLDLCRRLGDRGRAAALLNNLGDLALERGDLGAAETYLTDSCALFRALGDQRGEAVARSNLGTVRLERGDARGALAQYAAALRLVRELDEPGALAGGLVRMAAATRAVAPGAAGYRRAARLAGAAGALLAAHRAALEPWEQRQLDVLRHALGAEAYASAWVAGAALSPDDAVAEALAPLAPERTAAPV